MLILILSWSILIFAAISLGYLMLPCSGRGDTTPTDRAIVSTWTGLIALALAWLTLSLLLPLKRPIVLGLLLLVIVTGQISRKVRFEFRELFLGLTFGDHVILVILFFLLAFACSGEVRLFDTGLYHYQMIRMQEAFGSFRGAALIHFRFGFTSSWFSLGATLPPQALGGLCLLLGTLHQIVALRRIILGVASIADWFIAVALAIVIPLLLLDRGLAISPSPDVPMAMLTLVIGWWIIAVGNSKEQRILLLIIGLLSFSIKLSGAPIALILLINYIAPKWRETRPWITGAVVTAVTLSPILIVNFLVSGCPLFPSGAGCIDSLPWSIGGNEARRVGEIILRYARTEGQAPVGGRLLDWLPGWIIDGRTGSVSGKAFLFSSSILSGLLVAKRAGRLPTDLRLVAGIGFIGLVYVSSMAPTIRFGIGFLAILPAILISINHDRAYPLVPMIPLAVLLLTPFVELELRKVRMIALFLLAIIHVLSLFLTDRRLTVKLLKPLYWGSAFFLPFISLSGTRWNLISPAPILVPKATSLERIKAGELEIYLTRFGPLKNQCWGAPPLCTPDMPSEPLNLINHSRGVIGGVARSSSRQ